MGNATLLVLEQAGWRTCAVSEASYGSCCCATLGRVVFSPILYGCTWIYGCIWKWPKTEQIRAVIPRKQGQDLSDPVPAPPPHSPSTGYHLFCH